MPDQIFSCQMLKTSILLFIGFGADNIAKFNNIQIIGNTLMLKMKYESIIVLISYK